MKELKLGQLDNRKPKFDNSKWTTVRVSVVLKNRLDNMKDKAEAKSVGELIDLALDLVEGKK